MTASPLPLSGARDPLEGESDSPRDGEFGVHGGEPGRPIKFDQILGFQGDIGLAVEDSLSPLLFIKGFECCLISLAPTRLKTKPYPVEFRFHISATLSCKVAAAS